MRKVDLSRWEAYFRLREEGHSVERSARGAKIDPKTAWRFERSEPGSTGLQAAEELGIEYLGVLEVAPQPPLEAQRSLSDFGLFRRRYFGRRSTPWQERAAYVIADKLATEDREFGVINCPPGSGKSTLFTHDIPCWLIARNRSIRTLLGHRTERMARSYVGRVKRSLERNVPMAPDAEQHRLGLAHFADATMSGDYGEFKPPGRTDLWRSEALVVRQYGGYTTDDKEPTVSAFGADSGQLGGRYDFIVWDDLVDRRNLKGDSADTLREIWTTEFETRLEPGGLLILQGQRMAPDDLYRFCLDLTDLDSNPKYFHIVYPAHDDTKCRSEHDISARPWPSGCLLDPRRIPWKTLSVTQANTPRVFEIQYQQRDGSAAGELVQTAWIEGGIDFSGIERPGCKDRDRPMWVSNVPPNVGWSIVAVDPSPANFWGIGWWVMHPVSNTYELVAGIRRKMGSEELLSEDMMTRAFTGLLEDIRIKSHEVGHPLQAVVVEINAAQRFLLSQPHVQRWSQAHDIMLMPHTTTPFNKLTSEHNVTSIADYFRQGAIRLPYGDIEGKQFTTRFQRELVTWPDGMTDDLVMMCWFALRATVLSYADPEAEPPRMNRPEGLRTSRGMPTPGIMEQTLPYSVRTGAMNAQRT